MTSEPCPSNFLDLSRPSERSAIWILLMPDECPEYTRRHDDALPRSDLTRLYGDDGTSIGERVHAMIAAYAYIHSRMVLILRETEATIAKLGIPGLEQIEVVARALERIRGDALELGYIDTANHIGNRINTVRNGWIDPAEMKNDVKNIRERIQDDGKKLLLFRVEKDKSVFYNQGQLFGAKVATKFPDAQRDLVEAGSCYSLGCSTASVMHLMRALESSLKTLALAIPGITLKPKDTMGEIAKKISALAMHFPESTQSEIEHKRKVTMAAMHFQNITNALRNPTMHTGEFYSHDEANTAILCAKLFMIELADIV